MERRLIEEMVTMRGGRGRLEKIRDECVADRDRLNGIINYINDNLTKATNLVDEEPVDSNGE